MKYRVSGREVDLAISGLVEAGDDVCLIDLDENLAENCSWNDSGFYVSDLLSEKDFSSLCRGVSDLIMNGLRRAGCNVDSRLFSLENYHLYCTDDNVHLKVIAFLRAMSGLDNLPISHRIIDEKISDQCSVLVSSNVSSQIASGYFFIRIVRPSPYQDNNPPHKDVWLDRLRNAINLYIPLAGSNQNSSLSLVPGSHLWMESDIARTRMGALVNGVRYSVPSVVTEDDVLEMIRPEVKQGGAMLFSPYLIHGGAVNFNSDKTRVSIEMRFWRSPV